MYCFLPLHVEISVHISLDSVLFSVLANLNVDSYQHGKLIADTAKCRCMFLGSGCL